MLLLTRFSGVLLLCQLLLLASAAEEDNQTEQIEPADSGVESDEHNESSVVNATTGNNSTGTFNIRFNCTPVFRDATNLTSQLVLVNRSTLSNYLEFKTNFLLDLSWPTMASKHSVSEPGNCTLLIFYLDWCPFSASAAPHFNALGRLFPQFNVLAISATHMYSLTMRVGVVGVPSMYLFHNSKVVSRYNQSEARIEQFVHYIKTLTSLEPVDVVNITEADLEGPLKLEKQQQRSTVLFAGSWIFCFIFFFYYFLQSDLFRRLKDQVHNLWNEAQFQHEHIE